MGISRDDLAAILNEIAVIDSSGGLPDKVTGITQDSRLVEAGFIFAARRGAQSRGLDYVDNAVKLGAVLVVTDEAIPKGLQLPAIRVKDFHLALVILSHLVYGYPSQKITVIALTGTNGKSSCAFLLKSIFETAGYKCGLIGTNGYFDGEKWIQSTLTTPDIDRICALLSRAIDNDCKYVVMEASSHALSLGRLEGIRFAGAGFTNLTSEHLDFHKCMEEYSDAKALLFKHLPDDSLAVINVGDRWGERMIKASRCRVMTFARADVKADLNVQLLASTMKGGRFLIEYNSGSFEVNTPLIGAFQGENIALCATMGLGLGLPTDVITKGVASLPLVEGRMEPVDRGQSFAVYTDYSHTPDSLENALKSARNLGGKRLIVVFGCGGNRDRSKRPLMGAVAAELADKVIITSDNPREEEPASIIKEILTGIPVQSWNKVESVVDRRDAIKRAINIAQANDIVILSGKGHEVYQEINRVRKPFDDRKIAAEEIDRLTEAGIISKKKG